MTKGYEDACAIVRQGDYRKKTQKQSSCRAEFGIFARTNKRSRANSGLMVMFKGRT